MRYIITILMVIFSLSSYADNDLILQKELLHIAENARQQYHLPALEITVHFPNQKPIQIYSGQINSQSLFQVGSTTKTFTAALVLKLVELHKLDLDDPLRKFFPEYSKWSTITIRQLLNHTSGIFDYTDSFLWWYRLDLFRSKIWTPSELVEIAYHHAPYFLVGKGWHYSNTDYVLLGMIIEKVTQLKYREALDQYILSHDIHLPNTYYFPEKIPDEINTFIVHGYRNNKRDMTDINMSWLQAGGGMISNTNDLSNWYAALFSFKILSKESLNQMLEFVSLKDGSLIQNDAESGYGLSIFTMPTPSGKLWFTPGLTPGYTSLVAWLPCQKISFSYITNDAITKSGLHAYLISEILKWISETNNKECADVVKSNQVIFPRF